MIAMDLKLSGECRFTYKPDFFDGFFDQIHDRYHSALGTR